MVKAKLDLRSVEIPELAAKPLYAGVGAGDLAVEYVKDAVAEAQKRFAEAQKDVQTRVAGVQRNVKELDFQPKVLRDQASTVVSSRVEALTKDARDRATSTTATVTDTYAGLAKRGETLVARLRGEAPVVVAQANRPGPTQQTGTKPAPAKRQTAQKSSAKKAPAKRTTSKSTANGTTKSRGAKKA